MNVNNTAGMPPPRPMVKARMAMSEAVADMPVEAGESRVTVSISGQIEIERN